MVAERYHDLDMPTAIRLLDDSEARDLLMSLQGKVELAREEHERFVELCDRFDKLYYAEDFSDGGADLWVGQANIQGRAHVSVNTPAAYVDIPAALQAAEPIENILPTAETDEAREAAAALERIRYAWKRKEKWGLKRHKACTAKGIYGRVAARVYWEEDGDDSRPCAEIIDQPRNLWLGWKNDAYDKLQWSAYVQRMSPEAVLEEFSVDVEARDLDGLIVPYVNADRGSESESSRSWLNFGTAMIDVWDYWFLRKKGKLGELGGRTKMSVWNAVFVGNALVRYDEHPEYQGKLPIVPLFNSYLPGVPDGRSELYDMEPIIREKYERITAMSQMIAAATGGTAWQLVGPETTAGQVPLNAKPKLNQVISPGPGARIEALTPVVIQFQGEQYLDRLDHEGVTISGLNPLLLGHAPAQVLSSSKAINALIANYESRLSIKRGLLYVWETDIWDLVITVWAYKKADVAAIVDAGGGVLDITDPSLNPRDEMETMTRALNAVNGGLWAPERGMDATGVDDPETEKELIRKANTDATLNPAKVQVMVQLLAALQSVGAQAPAGVQQQAGAQLARGQNDLRTAMGAAGAENSTSSQLPGDQGVLPPEAGTPPPGGGLPFAQGPQAGPGLAQTMIQNGQAKSRILSSQPLGKRG